MISLVGLVYFSVSWIGPIRHSIFYPGGGFAFEVMLVLLFFLIITRVQKGGLFTLVISIVTIFLLGLGREFITYMALFITTLHLIIKSIQYKPKSQNGILFHIATKLESRDTLSLLLISASSVLSYIYVRSLVHAQGNNNITIDSIVTQGWFHLHIAEFIYPFFYGTLLTKFSYQYIVDELGNSKHHKNLVNQSDEGIDFKKNQYSKYYNFFVWFLDDRSRTIDFVCLLIFLEHLGFPSLSWIFFVGVSVKWMVLWMGSFYISSKSNSAEAIVINKINNIKNV